MLKESYGTAFAPFLTSHYSKIIVVDPREFNRDGKPSLDLTQFAKEQGVDDLLVINSPYMINNSYYIAWLGRLVGYSASYENLTAGHEDDWRMQPVPSVRQFLSPRA